jgi:hypothetical protein
MAIKFANLLAIYAETFLPIKYLQYTVAYSYWFKVLAHCHYRQD